MSALEQEVIDKFQQLDHAAQSRVLQRLILQDELLEGDFIIQESALTLGEWLESAIRFGDYIHAKYGDNRPSSVELLEEAREERLNDLMGSR
jgi:hypothetical protein